MRTVMAKLKVATRVRTHTPGGKVQGRPLALAQALAQTQAPESEDQVWALAQGELHGDCL